MARVISSVEHAALVKILTVCHYWFMREPGGEDRIGYENYVAIALLQDRLEGRMNDMEWYDAHIKTNAVEWMRGYIGKKKQE